MVISSAIKDDNVEVEEARLSADQKTLQWIGIAIFGGSKLVEVGV